MNVGMSQDRSPDSPPKIKRELICPCAPQRPIAISVPSKKPYGSNYNASFPTTCVWRRLGLKRMMEEEIEERKMQKKTTADQT
jgi:hypothetical protein